MSIGASFLFYIEVFIGRKKNDNNHHHHWFFGRDAWNRGWRPILLSNQESIQTLFQCHTGAIRRADDGHRLLRPSTPGFFDGRTPPWHFWYPLWGVDHLHHR